HARLLALDDTLRRRPLHARQESRARARAPDTHAVSGRLAQSRPLPRLGGRTPARATRDDARRPLSHEHSRGPEARAPNASGAAKGDEADSDGDGWQAHRLLPGRTRAGVGRAGALGLGLRRVPRGPTTLQELYGRRPRRDG